MSKFDGALTDLQKLVSEAGFKGKWDKVGNIDKFTTNDGGVLLFYTNKTLLCQGKLLAKTKLQEFVNGLTNTVVYLQNPTEQRDEIVTIDSDPVVFIVYGHDTNSRDQLELILSKMGIKHFIMSNNSGGGKTIIEALEEHIGVEGKASAGIVLLTADDEGYSKKAGSTSAKNRARQNVILEMGMLMAKLGRKHTIILKKGEIEAPSDADGILYISYTEHVSEVAAKIIRRLEEINFPIDHKLLLQVIK